MIDKVHPAWQTIRSQLVELPKERFRENPLALFCLLSTSMPDLPMREHAEELNPAIFARVMEAVDDEAVGYDPSSSKAAEIRERSSRQAYYVVRLLDAFGSLAGAHVLEIGAGFGYVAHLLMRLEGIASYTIVDIPGVVEIQDYFLSNVLEPEARSRITLLNVESDADMAQLAAIDADLVISTFALTEMPRTMQEFYLTTAVARAKSAYIVGQRDYQGTRNDDYFEQSLASCFNHVELVPFVYERVGSLQSFEIFASGKG